MAYMMGDLNCYFRLDELTPEVDLISCESDDDDAPGNITAIVDLDADD